jgi:hypothetical protein
MTEELLRLHGQLFEHRHHWKYGQIDLDETHHD